MALTQESPKDTESFGSHSAAQYGSVEELSAEAKGNPNLVYSSELINSFEPSGVPISTGIFPKFLPNWMVNN
jgi:catechol O-methyltransferase